MAPLLARSASCFKRCKMLPVDPNTVSANCKRCLEILRLYCENESFKVFNSTISPQGSSEPFKIRLPEAMRIVRLEYPLAFPEYVSVGNRKIIYHITLRHSYCSLWYIVIIFGFYLHTTDEVSNISLDVYDPCGHLIGLLHAGKSLASRSRDTPFTPSFCFSACSYITLDADRDTFCVLIMDANRVRLSL